MCCPTIRMPDIIMEKVRRKGCFSLGYQVINVKERMTAKNMTAREALISILQERYDKSKRNQQAERQREDCNLFPPQATTFFTTMTTTPATKASRRTPLTRKTTMSAVALEIYGGNFVIKGDGPDKTRLIMETPNLPTSISNLSSSPILLAIKHTNGRTMPVTPQARFRNRECQARRLYRESQRNHRNLLRTVGTVALTQRRQGTGKEGNRSDCPQRELGDSKSPYLHQPKLRRPVRVKITEFHQVKSAANGKITFYEPIMHDIDIKYNDTEGWEIRTYKYLENVGIEDLSFVGNALDGYAHHGEGHAEQAKVGWQYDGAYKPLLLQRVVNSWVRNVHFESVSEALTFCRICQQLGIRYPYQWKTRTFSRTFARFFTRLYRQSPR